MIYRPLLHQIHTLERMPPERVDLEAGDFLASRHEHDRMRERHPRRLALEKFCLSAAR